MHTNKDAADYIARAIELAGSDVAKPSEYDVDGIARYLHVLTGTWDMSAVAHDTFWAAVARHAKVQHLMDAEDATTIGVATPEQIEASHKAGVTGIILIDADGDVVSEQDETQPWVPQPVRRVYVEA